MSDHAYSIKRIGLRNVSVFLVHYPGKALLVDAGNEGSEIRILEAMLEVGLEPGMLKWILLTHAHFDHAGAAGKLKELTGCRIVIHAFEAAGVQKGFTPLPPGTRWKARLLVGAGRILAGRLGKYSPAEPDLLVHDTFDLREFGFPGRIIHTPGHTRGSVVVLMEGGELFGGDTLFGLENKQHFPPFAEDLPALVNSWKAIRNLPVTTIYPAHGRPFSFQKFQAEYPLAMERYGSGIL